MKIGILVFEGFTDLDFYLPWDLLNRVRLLKISENWNVSILGDKDSVTSAAGLKLSIDKPFHYANECDAVLFCSGPHTRTLIKDAHFLSSFQFKSEQLLAAIDSGALILAALGLLKNMKATTYPTAFEELEGMGVMAVKSAFVEQGNIATAARCLSGDKLALWIIKKLISVEAAEKVFDSVKPLE